MEVIYETEITNKKDIVIVHHKGWMFKPILNKGDIMKKTYEYLAIILCVLTLMLAGCAGKKSEAELRTKIAAPYMGLEGMQLPPPEVLDQIPHFNPPVPSDAKVHRNLEYTTYQGKSKQLDIYLPATEGPHPVIVFVHGGAFMMGKRTQMPIATMEQLNRGYAIASITYSLSGEAQWPTAMYQIKAAVRWLRAHAKEYNLDPDKFIAWGPSSGGTYVSVLGASGDVKELEDLSLGNSEYSSRVQGVIAYYPSSDLKFMMFGGNAKPGNFAEQLLGCHPIECPEKSDSANASTYATADDPPFYLMHGTSDAIVPHDQSSLMYDALLKAKVDATFISLPGYVHGDPRFDNQVNRQGIEAFLDKVAGR